MKHFNDGILRKQGRDILKKLEAEDGIGIVLLARPVSQRSGPESRDPRGVPEAGLPRASTQDSLPD